MRTAAPKGYLKVPLTLALSLDGERGEKWVNQKRRA